MTNLIFLNTFKERMSGPICVCASQVFSKTDLVGYSLEIQSSQSSYVHRNKVKIINLQYLYSFIYKTLTVDWFVMQINLKRAYLVNNY